jgi:putative oxidoreductase
LLDIVLVALSRCLLVILFLPFSALDKVLNFKDAEAQASLALRNRTWARLAILSGFCIEVVMSLGVVSGVADRAAALVLAAYCAATALLWKQFWKSGDFRLKGRSRGRNTFWDFLKNFALAGGFLSLTFAGHAAGVGDFLRHPFDSSHPYRTLARAAHEIFLRIDHSAVSVRDTAISTAFYRSLGFAVTAETCDHGVEQAALDDDEVSIASGEVLSLYKAGWGSEQTAQVYRRKFSDVERLRNGETCAASRVQGILVDEKSWAIRYLIVNTSNWWLGHQVLIAPQWIVGVSWNDRKVSVRLSRAAVKGSPPYAPGGRVGRDEEASIYDHYRRPGYWAREVQLQNPEFRNIPRLGSRTIV